MNSNQFREAAHAAVDEIADYFDTIQDRRVSSAIEPGYLRPLLPEGPPQEGEAWPEIQKDIKAKIMPGLTHWQSPNFMAYFPTALSFPAILGELYSAALSSPGFNWQCSPAMTELETTVLDWLAKILHLPACFHSTAQGGGVIQGSASESIVTVMVAARERHVERACKGLSGKEKAERSSHIRSRLVALGGEQSHSSTAKAAKIAGVAFRAIPTRFEDDLALTGNLFEQALQQCKREGLEPFYLTATFGTTATCAIDHIGAITDINNAAKHCPPLWIHIDAAWAGAALILDDYAHFTKGFEHVDSFDVNMHKWLLVNFDCSCLFVRNKRDLTDVLCLTPSYLRNVYSDGGLVTDYRDWQIPLGRRFRSLKMWFVIRSYGVEGMKAHIRRHLDLAAEFAGWIKGRPDLFRIVTPPAFALTALTVVPPAVTGTDMQVVEAQLKKPQDLEYSDLTGENPPIHEPQHFAANDLAREVYDHVNASGKLFLTSTVVNGVYFIRIVSANQDTSQHSLRSAFELLVETCEDVILSVQSHAKDQK